MKAEQGVFIVMGVSGCGKSTLGKALAERLRLPFFDGDDFHPPENIQKMADGVPLDDSDRAGWLKSLNQLALQHKGKGAVIACSALKEAYRKLLEMGLAGDITWIYLYGNYQDILQRMSLRESHYMPSSLLKSQFKALEPPAYGVHIPISLSTADAVSKILESMDST
jgi:carbohydrate kinase (thermoresistant glucokinase family)